MTCLVQVIFVLCIDNIGTIMLLSNQQIIKELLLWVTEQ